MKENLDTLLFQAIKNEFSCEDKDNKYWLGRIEALRDLKKLNEMTKEWQK